MARIAVADPDPFARPHGTDPDATTLFDQARELAKQGKLDQACARFEQSFALERALGTELNIADCRERQGRLREAITLFDEVAERATAAHDAARATFARNRIAALAPRVGELVMTLENPFEAGYVITVDDWPVKLDSIMRVYAEPKTVTIRETARGGFAHTERIVLVAGSATAIHLPSPVATSTVMERDRTWLYAGVIAAVAGGVFLIASAAEHSAASSEPTDLLSYPGCSESLEMITCTDPVQGDKFRAALDAADGERTRSYIFLGVGLGVALAGVATIVWAPEHAVAVTPTIGTHEAGLALSFSF